MIAIAVACRGGPDRGWTCEVTLREHGLDVSRHRVRVAVPDLARLAPGTSTPDALVKRSFEFLLEHEPPSSILRAFDLTEIGRYFPAYETEIRGRV